MSAGTSPSRLGYDTRSLRSALVMRTVDALNPFKREREFAWTGPCVISSIAGLGDLFIHLPLIAGLVQECRRRGFEVRVALRPAHVALGESCGWEVLPFDNALEDFFKKPSALRPVDSLGKLRRARRTAPSLWIDLTGNAVSALAIKLAGAKTLAARITRGGRSLVDFPLPHTIGENEYGNINRIAERLGCVPDHQIVRRLEGEPLPEGPGSVILCLTTICRWRNWPLQNFLALVDRFPTSRFVATGLRAEVIPEESATLDEILSRPNVTSRVDRLSLLELIRLIAHAGAVVTNDTSTAHIANAFRKPGVVLFGPASPDRFGADFGLRNFVDRSCPFHPCVQWKCSNQVDWCMQKISPLSVGDYLATLPGFAS